MENLELKQMEAVIDNMRRRLEKCVMYRQEDVDEKQKEIIQLSQKDTREPDMIDNLTKAVYELQKLICDRRKCEQQLMMLEDITEAEKRFLCHYNKYQED